MADFLNLLCRSLIYPRTWLEGAGIVLRLRHVASEMAWAVCDEMDSSLLGQCDRFESALA